MTISAWTVIDYKGHLAIALPWVPDHDSPVDTRDIRVSGVAVSHFPHIVDKHLENLRGYIGLVYGKEVPTVVDTTDWKPIVETRPVKKPRKGKGYDWVWESGKWRKERSEETD